MDAMVTTLYRLFDAEGALLYVGISQYPKDRLKQHRASKAWWSLVARTTTETHPTRAAAEEAERVAIAREEPRYNIAHVGRPYTSLAEVIEQWKRADPTAWAIELEETRPGFWDVVATHDLLVHTFEAGAVAESAEEIMADLLPRLKDFARERIAEKLYELRGPVVIYLPPPSSPLEPAPIAA
jgi:predicted GIY-YIG superfamily endonuclease